MVCSFTWVACFSVLITAVTSRWVELSGVDAGFFGTTIVALGGQIPDALQSVAVARKGHGSMAVANAIGSQNLNILIGLGGPWLLVCCLGGDIRLPTSRTLLAASGMLLGHIAVFASLTLGTTVMLRRSKVLLSPRLGKALIVLYAVSVLALVAAVFGGHRA